MPGQILDWPKLFYSIRIFHFRQTISSSFYQFGSASFLERSYRWPRIPDPIASFPRWSFIFAVSSEFFVILSRILSTKRPSKNPFSTGRILNSLSTGTSSSISEFTKISVTTMQSHFHFCLFIFRDFLC